ncbi:bifunctional DNA primase/polymerase [Tsukamurella asaccharolytica]|uniref:bifunctional DNA primase/polymerase n=1 Tax=Tsukamurella asaccharolytica TaxID=2592067 RepID=UPI0013159AB9|nr:bifunctional DNA primase/polymerase [Tsukamurella asaccharolytica]
MFPLVPGQKNPLTSHGFHDASRNLDRIVQWWTETPAANIGVPVPVGFIVIDADLYKPGAREDLIRLEEQCGPLPAGPTVRTARGGLQFWLRCSAGDYRAKAGPTIDIRAGGKHYVVAPPSVFEGGRYEWIA